MNHQWSHKAITRAGAGVLVTIVWASVCTTQDVARQLGFNEVLGPPLLFLEGVAWTAPVLTHAGAAAIGVGTYALITSRGGHLGARFLAVGPILVLLGAGPVYSPHRLIAWIPAIWGEPMLYPILPRAFGVGVAAAAWGGSILAMMMRKESIFSESRRWAAPSDGSPAPEENQKGATDENIRTQKAVEAPPPDGSWGNPVPPPEKGDQVPENSDRERVGPDAEDEFFNTPPADSDDALNGTSTRPGGSAEGVEPSVIEP